MISNAAISNGDQHARGARRGFLTRLARDQRGNTLFLVAASMIPLLGVVGSAVDISRAYMAKLRLQQACDAGVLAGRRAMGANELSGLATEEAAKMFRFNFPEGLFGTDGAKFDVGMSPDNANEVLGAAETTLPTSIMRILNVDQFDLNVECQAKLEISNTDIMLVLDTTGSMTTVNPGDSVTRIEALKTVTLSFFDTISAAQTGDGRIRYGVVPFSSSVNVGSILTDADPDWIADSTELPSRTVNFNVTQQPDSNWTGSATNSAITYGTWTTVSFTTGLTQAACEAQTAPAPTAPATSGSANTTQTGQTTNPDGSVTTSSNTAQGYTQTFYRYSFNTTNGRCRLQSRPGTYTANTPSSVTRYPEVRTFRDYTYDNITFDVTDIKQNGSMTVPNGPNGAEVTATWNGCIMERATKPFPVNASIPKDALDLDVDLVPNADEDTQWRMVLPQLAYPRASAPWIAPSTGGAYTSVDDHYDYADPYVNSLGWGVCPSPAMKLTTLTAADRSTFETYINALTAVGGTLHDAGMAWGVRLMSPTGLFASENDSAPNGNPISRHLIFMTDGETQHRLGNYGYQGYNYTMNRVGGNTDTELTARTVRRFHILCDAAKARNITVWVVSFGVAMSPNMSACASGDKAYQADNAAELEAKFQLIAAQISKLRLSQ